MDKTTASSTKTLKHAEKDRSAHATLFGFDFQVNAAIFLLLKDITNLNSVKMEGEREDIDLEYSDRSHIIAQAKAVEKPNNDFHNVLRNMKESIMSLKETYDKYPDDDIKQMLFITNSINPFHTDNNNIFNSALPTYVSYQDLPENYQEVIDKYAQYCNLNTDKFYIFRLPFVGNDEDERYKYIEDKVEKFLYSLNLKPYKSKELLKIWQKDIFHNGSVYDKKLKLNKDQLIWPLIIIESELSQNDMDNLETHNPEIYEEVLDQYHETIDSSTNDFEFYNKVIQHYRLFQKLEKHDNPMQAFIESNWKEYSSHYAISSIDSDVLEALTRLVLQNILKHSRVIEKIKKGVNL